MAKEQEKKLAKELYINKNCKPEEIVVRLGNKVSLRTIQRWEKDGNWKAQRDAKANGPQQRIERTQLVVDSLVDERLQILKDLAELQKEKANQDPTDKEALKLLDEQIGSFRKQAASIDDAISKWNKRIENLNQEGKITLSLYMEVMDRIFEALRLANEAVYMQSLDFQENHLEDISAKLL